MRRQTFLECVTAVLLATLVPWCTGCATGIETTQRTSASPGNGGGELTVRIYETSSKRKNGQETRRKILSELYRTEGGEQRLVREETLPEWSVSDLPPGEYELRVAKWQDKDGRTRTLATARHKKFVVSSGQRTSADVVIYGSRSGWWVLAALAGVVIAVGVSAAEPGSWKYRGSDLGLGH
jgi:hypothetical protein